MSSKSQQSTKRKTVYLQPIKMTKRKPKSQHKPAWRPSEMTETIVKKLEEAFSLDCSVWEACFYANISRQTYYNRLENEPELVDRFAALREKPVLLARQTVVKAVKENPDIALKYLERKRKDEFSTRTETTWKDWWPVEQITTFTLPDNNRNDK